MAPAPSVLLDLMFVSILDVDRILTRPTAVAQGQTRRCLHEGVRLGQRLLEVSITRLRCTPVLIVSSLESLNDELGVLERSDVRHEILKHTIRLALEDCVIHQSIVEPTVSDLLDLVSRQLARLFVTHGATRPNSLKNA